MALRNAKIKTKQVKSKSSFDIFTYLGIFFLALSLIIPTLTFFPVAKAEVTYQIKAIANPTPAPIIPVDTDFSIVIPKINANSKIIKNVDPYDSSKYQVALTKGVAHSLTSSLPNQIGNVFLFAHSAGNWYQANQYNAVFYLINKLVTGDEIIIYYQNQPYHYLVSDSKLVNPDQVDYLKKYSNNSQLTLMTCWPPGTTLKRQIVVAQLQSQDK